jgi:hypothetical protein
MVVRSISVLVLTGCSLPERALAADRDRGQLRTLAVSKQCVGLALQDVAEDLAIVEC